MIYCLKPVKWSSLRSLQIIKARKGVEKRRAYYHVGGNVNWYSHSGKQYGSSLKKLRIELPCNPAILLQKNSNSKIHAPLYSKQHYL